MQPMATIRKWHLDQLRNAVVVLEMLVNDLSAEAALSLRDGADGWTIPEVVGHLLDFEGVFIERARLTLTQDLPALPFPDHEALVKENDYANADLKTLVIQWAERRQQFIALLQTIGEDNDTQWERPATHPTRGPFTLNDQLLLAVWHDMNHLQQIANMLSTL